MEYSLHCIHEYSSMFFLSVLCIAGATVVLTTLLITCTSAQGKVTLVYISLHVVVHAIVYIDLTTLYCYTKTLLEKDISVCTNTSEQSIFQHLFMSVSYAGALTNVSLTCRLNVYIVHGN